MRKYHWIESAAFKRFNAASILPCIVFASMAAVTLTNQKIDLSSQNVTLRSDHTIASVNSGTVTLSFDAPVMENEFLKVTLLPGWGGRVRSIVYKPTGNEETNPGQIGGPSSMGAGSFFYDYLWVIGGFYPTIGPEHGKYFNLPWDWKILTNTKDTAAIAMYQVDSIPWRQGYAGKFSAYNATNIQVEYIVRLVTGKTGYETEVTLKNPDSRSKTYEYWESCSMFPGNSGSSGGYEFITPETKFQIDSWCTGIMNVDKSAGADYFVYFDKLRFLKNWPAAGIMYGHNYPFNFWGVIDHNDAHEEGIMRICDNKYTIGVKIWGSPPSLFEIWPGTCNRFFSPATLQANQTITWKAWYTPTVGLTNVTDASEQMMINLTTDKTAYDGTVDQTLQATCQVFSIMPAKAVHARLRLEGGGSIQTVCDTTLTPDPKSGNVIRRAVPVKSVYNGTTALTASFVDAAGASTLLNARKTLSFSNANPVVGVLTGTACRIDRGMPRHPVNVYSLDGRLVSVLKNAAGAGKLRLGKGVYFLTTENNRPGKMVRFTVQ
jgi:hypothetical protein